MCSDYQYVKVPFLLTGLIMAQSKIWCFQRKFNISVNQNWTETLVCQVFVSRSVEHTLLYSILVLFLTWIFPDLFFFLDNLSFLPVFTSQTNSFCKLMISALLLFHITLLHNTSQALWFFSLQLCWTTSKYEAIDLVVHWLVWC